MAKKKYSREEKKAYRNGFFAGLFKAKKKKKPKSKELKKYSFQAFNDNCDVFNVTGYGFNKADALKNIQKHLKVDPSMNQWKVEVTNHPANFDEYFRNINVSVNGNISDNMPYYR